MNMKRLMGAALVASCVSAASAQELLDRVLARVDGAPIRLSDTRAALRLGLIDAAAGVDPLLFALRQLIERRLVLAEVARFAPPEPDAAALAGEVKAMRERVGSAADLAALEKTTGYGDEQIREIARDTLRIQAYLNGRFGASVQPSDEEVGEYYRTHPQEFTRDGRVLPFLEVEADARHKAATERRRAIIRLWMRDLYERADVVELYQPK